MGPWTGSGPILTGTCSTAAWTLFDLSTAYLWAPVIGCVEDKIDCCPSSFAFVTTTSTASSTPSATSSASSAHTSTSSDLASPTVITNITLHESSPDGAVRTVDTLNQPLVIVVEPRTVERRAVAGNGVIKCPEDYVSVGATGCCPFGMSATQTPGLSTACASKLSAPFPAPECSSTGLSSGKPMSTATNVVYAVQYQIYNLEFQPPKSDPNSGLSMGAKAGIGAGCGVLALILFATLANFIMRKRRKGKQGISAGSGTGMTGEKPENPIGGGPAELGAADVKRRYELSNSQIKRVSSPPVMPGTPTYELSGTPTPEFSSTPRPRHQQSYLGSSVSGYVMPQIDEHQTHGGAGQVFFQDNQGYHQQQPVAYTGQPVQHYQRAS